MKKYIIRLIINNNISYTANPEKKCFWLEIEVPASKSIFINTCVILIKNL